MVEDFRCSCGSGGPLLSTAISRCGVHPGHQLTVGGASGVELLAALFKLASESHDLLLQHDDPLPQLVDIGGSAEPGLAPALRPPQLGEFRL